MVRREISGGGLGVPGGDAPQLGLVAQLDTFLTMRRDLHARRVLVSPAVDVHVRRNSRTLPREIPCLDVVTINLKTPDSMRAGTDVAPWTEFVGGATDVAGRHGLQALYLAEVTDPTVLAWAAEQGLQNAGEFYPGLRSPESFVIWTSQPSPSSR